MVKSRAQSNYYDRGYGQQYIVVQVRYFPAEKVTYQRNNNGPGNISYSVKEHEKAVTHPSYSGYGRGESPYDRNKVREEHRLAPVSFKKYLAFMNVILPENYPVRFFKQPPSVALSDTITGIVAEYR